MLAVLGKSPNILPEYLDDVHQKGLQPTAALLWVLTEQICMLKMQGIKEVQ